MDRMGLKEGEVIQHSMMTKSIERAQKKVEENNFGVRKRLLEYDDVMNSQREVVYKRRRHALHGERLKVDIANMIYDTCENIVNDNKAVSDFKNFEFDLIRYFSITSPVSESEFSKLTEIELSGQVYKTALAYYEEKNLIVEDTCKGQFFKCEFETKEDFDVSKLSPIITEVGEYVNIITGLRYDDKVLEVTDYGDYWSKGFYFYLT
jgi:preprotein translocase subunit SecA